jgi:hypothetical protein
MAALIEQICHEAPALTTPTGVEAVLRQHGAVRLLHLLNHGATEVCITLNAPAVDLLTAKPHTEQITLAAQGVAILKQSL